MSITDPTDAVELLLVEDNHDDAQFIERLIDERHAALEREGTDAPLEIAAIDHVDCLEAALERIRTDSPDVVLLDLLLPDSRGLETIERVVEYAPDLPIVVVTGQNETEIGVEAIQCGAQEYLSKGTVTGETILRTLRYAIDARDTSANSSTGTIDSPPQSDRQTGYSKRCQHDRRSGRPTSTRYRPER